MEKFTEMPIMTWQGVSSEFSKTRIRPDVSDCPKSIPMSMLNEEYAKKNHYQSLQELAGRGGLDPREALAIINSHIYYDHNYGQMSLREAIDELKRKVEEYKK
jgi:hypothetical protein